METDGGPDGQDGEEQKQHEGRHLGNSEKVENGGANNRCSVTADDWDQKTVDEVPRDLPRGGFNQDRSMARHAPPDGRGFRDGRLLQVVRRESTR